MNKSKYKLVPVIKNTDETITYGEAVAYGDDNTVVFGGDWGRYDEKGSPLYVWQENIPAGAEVISENNASIKAQIEVLEIKSARAMREITLYKDSTAADEQAIYPVALSKLSEYETQIKALRAQLQ